MIILINPSDLVFVQFPLVYLVYLPYCRGIGRSFFCLKHFNLVF